MNMKKPTWNKPSNQPAKSDDKTKALGFVKSILLQLYERGKNDVELLAFVSDPSPKSLGMTDVDPVRDYFYHFIKLHTTENERHSILIELDKEGKLPSR